MVTRANLVEARGRRVLLWALLFFFGIQQLCGFLMDSNWQSLRFPSSAYIFGKWREAREQGDILIFGSSRFAGLDMGAVQAGLEETGTSGTVRVFNASMGAGDLVTAEYMLHELMQRGACPKLVVLEVSPETVTHSNRWILEHFRRQLTWKDLPRFLPDVFREGHFLRLLQARLLPLYMHRHEIWKWAWKPAEEASKPPPLTTKATSQVANPVKANCEQVPSRTLGGLKEEVPRWLRNYQVGGGTSEVALERLLSRCRKRGIRVVMVGVPVSSAHRGMYTPQIEASFKKYVEHYVESDFCTFVDCRDQVPDSMFQDHHHLSAEGANFFGHRLGKEVLAPKWTTFNRFTPQWMTSFFTR